ncbi:lipopolysaccharide biosynthesis protein [bacterium]|nr:lipopolysaccharide biosynthesis protein [bacterium]
MRGASRIGQNTAFMGAGTLLVSLFLIVQMKIFTVALSPQDYGLLLALRALSGLVTAAAVIGLPQVAMRFLPQLEVRRERGPLLRFSGALLGLMVLSTAAVMLLAWLARPMLMAKFNLDIVGDEFFVLTLSLAASLGLYELAMSLLQGIRRMGWVALSQVLFQGALSIHFFFIRDELTPGLALWLYTIYTLVPGIGLLIIFPFLLPSAGKAAQPLRFDRKEFFSYWRMGLLLRWMVLASLDLDRYVLSFFAGMEMISFFNIPARMMGVSRRFLQASITALQTEVSRLHEERRDHDLPARLALFMRGQVSLSFWMAGALFLAAKPLILMVSTPDYLAGLPLFALLLWTLPLSSLSSPIEGVFRGLDGLSRVLVGNILWTLGYFGSLPFLVPKLGLMGLGLAQVGAMTLQAGWMIASGRRRGLLENPAALSVSMAWGAAPVALAITLAMLLPGGETLAPSTLGVVLGLATLALGVLWIVRGQHLFTSDEKIWLLGRVGKMGLRRAMARILRVEVSA